MIPEGLGFDFGLGLTALLFGVAVFLTVYAIMAPVREMPKDDYRELIGVEAPETPANGGLFDRIVRPALRNFMPQSPMSAQNNSITRDKTVELLVRSGNPWNIQPEEYTGLRYLSALFMFFVFLVLSEMAILPAYLPTIGWMFGGALLGFSLPKVLLDKEKGKRRKSAQKGLPEALDLLRITLVSGMNFQPALGEVCTRLPEGIVRDELTRVSDDLRAGKSLSRAMLDFARRAPSDEVESFCKAVVQSEKLGSDVSDTLQQQSLAARASYEADLDKKIGQLPTTLFIPILCLMLPSLFIIILAPAFQNISKAF